MACLPDYYRLLSVHSKASLVEIKQAYHAALLNSHPDKARIRNPTHDAANDATIDIALLKEAYNILSDAQMRQQYDAQRHVVQSNPRPAQIISLEDFVEEESLEDGASLEIWTHACRCGGSYEITGTQMEIGQHLVGCGSCSEVIWVGYEVAEDD